MYIRKYSVTWSSTIKEDGWFMAVNHFQIFQKSNIKKKKTAYTHTSTRVGSKKVVQRM